MRPGLSIDDSIAAVGSIQSFSARAKMPYWSIYVCIATANSRTRCLTSAHFAEVEAGISVVFPRSARERPWPVRIATDCSASTIDRRTARPGMGWLGLSIRLAELEIKKRAKGEPPSCSAGPECAIRPIAFTRAARTILSVGNTYARTSPPRRKMNWSRDDEAFPSTSTDSRTKRTSANGPGPREKAPTRAPCRARPARDFLNRRRDSRPTTAAIVANPPPAGITTLGRGLMISGFRLREAQTALADFAA